MLIDEINDQFGLNVDTEDYDTIGGWLSSRLEVPPHTKVNLSCMRIIAL